MTDAIATKTIRQYSEKLPEETMSFLLGIAEDYNKVKNYVYLRYSGVKSISKLTPGYTVLNEMRVCGLRKQLNLPVVYYELAIFEAIKDVKTMWRNLKNKINELISRNRNLTEDDLVYLRTVLKFDSVYDAIVNYREYETPNNAKDLQLDVKRLNNLLRRLSRKYKPKLQAGASKCFKVSPNGYSYKDGGIKFVSRIPRKRVFIPLKDNATYKRQIDVIIKDDHIELSIPVETKIKKHKDYVNTVFINIGFKDMFTLSSGNVYGEGLNTTVNAETDRLIEKNGERRKAYNAYKKSLEVGNVSKSRNIMRNNMGKKKYMSQKEQRRAQTTTYINAEINRMLRTEKPRRIVTTKMITKGKSKFSRSAKAKLSRSFEGYIRRRLEFKCRINSIELLYVNPFGIGIKCSRCGRDGERKNDRFSCENCGLNIPAALNSAKNTEKKFEDKFKDKSKKLD